MLSFTQVLIFELGSACNLGPCHAKCPNLSPLRYANLDRTHLLDDDTIVACACQAYREFGFAGMIGWHYYNEPTLSGSRMLELHKRIRAEVPIAKFFLITNGTRKAWVEIHLDEFARCSTSDYTTDPNGKLLDDRLSLPRREANNDRCLRPYVECIFDTYGNHHPCCADWQGIASLGNVFTSSFATIARRWRQFQLDVCGDTMTERAPDWCKTCRSHFRYDPIQPLDSRTYKRIENNRTELNPADCYDDDFPARDMKRAVHSATTATSPCQTCGGTGRVFFGGLGKGSHIGQCPACQSKET